MDDYKEAMKIMDELRVTMKQVHNKDNKPFRKVEFHALIAIQEYRHISMQSLGDELGITKPRVTAIINNLIDKGMVEQKADSKDKRKKLLQLTSAGEEYMKKEYESYEQWFKNLWDQFTKEEQNNWKHIIAKINVVIRRELMQEEK